MKKSIFVIGVLFAFNSYSQEVHLLCKGVVKWTSDQTLVEKIYELTIDDKKGTIPSFTVGLAPGCFESEHTSGSCSCRVNKITVSCESETRGKTNPAFVSKNSFTINRYTGRMQTFQSSVGDNNYQSGNTGEFMCEKFTSRKF